MQDLAGLLEQQVVWDLEGLCREANARLSRYLPLSTSQRVREEVTPRLVRHYTRLGVLDPPLRQGKRALYTPRHLLQLLVLRRLMAEGYASSALGDLVRRKSDEELLALLEGGATLAPNPSNPALGYLGALRKQFGMPMATLSSPPEEEESQEVWRRFEVALGLEVHLREDFPLPKTPREMEALLDAIRNRLEGLRLQGSGGKRSRRQG